jgi:hypothetical protein
MPNFQFSVASLRLSLHVKNETLTDFHVRNTCLHDSKREFGARQRDKIMVNFCKNWNCCNKNSKKERREAVIEPQSTDSQANAQRSDQCSARENEGQLERKTFQLVWLLQAKQFAPKPQELPCSSSFHEVSWWNGISIPFVLQIPRFADSISAVC